MKMHVLCVGRPGGLLADAIGEYESRARRYWPLDVIEVKEERAGKGVKAEAIRAAESARLLERVPKGARVVALTRTGDSISSERLAKDLATLAVQGAAGVAWLIGGAYGLSDEVLKTADARQRLSTLTLTHEMARLVLAEQLYRAGTIVRGEPYHKARGKEG